MKITNLNIIKGFNDGNGLKEIKMERLENVVLIAGRNGAGKSRLLDTITNIIKHSSLSNSVSSREEKIKSLKKILRN